MIFDSQTATRRRYSPLAVSLMLHGSALLWIVQSPSLPQRAPSEYRQKIAGKENKIVFYKFRTDLPKVTPPIAKDEKLPLRAETKAKQSIVSSPKEAPKSARMIWTPAPEIAPAALELPNIVAVKLPEPPAKPFVPPDLVKPRIAKVDVSDAPELAPPASVTAELKTTQLPHKTFVQPTTLPKRLTVPTQLAPDAPSVEAAEAHTAQLPSSKLPPRPFSAPARSGRGSVARVATASEAPPIAANSTELNIAVVGLNPTDKLVPLPAASSPGQFSAGPVVRPKGADSEGGGSGLSIPNLFVRGPEDKPAKKTDLLAQAFAAPTSSETLRAVMSKGEPMAAPPRDEGTPAALAHTGATKVSGAPDPRFNGRDVFMMAIQMPNITSYSGSWLMWYADRTAREAGLAPISPPVAHRKVDPKYIATAVSDRVEGRVTLGCVIDKTGHVSGVEVIRGLDERLNKSAEEAMSKWEFYPATRQGIPVEVDVLVEIPFHLEPKIERR
jgi:TonB family protein